MDERNYPQTEAKAAGMLSARRLDITLRQNLDERIKEAKARVAALESTKNRMESSGILDMRIDDIQDAMRW